MHAVSPDPEWDEASLDGAGSGPQIGDVSVDSERMPPLAQGELVAGRYSVERMLASGGMGIVWLGRHVELEQPVAIKFLRRSLSQNAALVARFLDEARAAAALRSEHVVRVVDVGQLATGIPYFVMEYLDGTDLETLVKRDGPLGVERTVDYVLQACEGLAEAHRAGIVHRDVKPENLFLIQRPGQKAIVKVVDFGIAKRLNAARAKVITGPQDNMGSPCYMSPEQMASPHAIDARTDIWSLGVVTYQLLTGELPFDGDSLVEVFARVANARARPLSEVRPEIDPHLDAIVQRCLAKDPEARYDSIAALAEALRNYQAGALSRTSPSIGAMPLSLRSDAPVAMPKIEHPSRGVGFAAALLAVAALGAGAAVLVQTDAAVVRRVANVVRPPLLAPSDDRTADRDLVGRREVGPFVVEPFGVIGKDGAVRAEPELALDDDDDDDEDAKIIDAPSTEAPEPKRSSKIVTPTLPAAEGEPNPNDALERQRAYRAYLEKHHWRPLNEVLEELKGSGNSAGEAPAAAPSVEPAPPAAGAVQSAQPAAEPSAAVPSSAPGTSAPESVQEPTHPPP